MALNESMWNTVATGAAPPGGVVVSFSEELQNGSDHKVVANYSGLYEECSVSHINVYDLVS